MCRFRSTGSARSAARWRLSPPRKRLTNAESRWLPGTSWSTTGSPRLTDTATTSNPASLTDSAAPQTRRSVSSHRQPIRVDLKAKPLRPSSRLPARIRANTSPTWLTELAVIRLPRHRAGPEHSDAGQALEQHVQDVLLKVVEAVRALGLVVTSRTSLRKGISLLSSATEPACPGAKPCSAALRNQDTAPA